MTLLRLRPLGWVALGGDALTHYLDRRGLPLCGAPGLDLEQLATVCAEHGGLLSEQVVPTGACERCLAARLAQA